MLNRVNIARDKMKRCPYHMSRPVPVSIQHPQELSHRSIIGDGVSHGLDTREQVVSILLGQYLPAAIRILISFIFKIVYSLAISLPYINHSLVHRVSFRVPDKALHDSWLSWGAVSGDGITVLEGMRFVIVKWTQDR